MNLCLSLTLNRQTRAPRQNLMDETQVTTESKLESALFWRSPATKRAQFATDVWASLVWHSERMPVPTHRIEVRNVVERDVSGKVVFERQSIERVPVPTGEEYVLEGDCRVLTRDTIRGRRRSGLDVERPTSVPAFRGHGEVHDLLLVKLTVEHAIKAVDDPQLVGLLLTMYPRVGPYARRGRYRDYRPAAWEAKVLEGYEGANPGRVLDNALKRLHRHYLEVLVGAILSPDFGGK